MYIHNQVTQAEGGQPIAACFVYNSEKDALSAYHSFLASCYANASLVYFMGSIQGVDGNIIIKGAWFSPEP